ncbi:MAG: isoleucine--tRNA ligase [Holosporaceae bacterium]|jgi:isoleucyl-tRNA synthetase|nr:isoleucine--tRNA ligase [Holosporaceae bacterium]
MDFKDTVFLPKSDFRMRVNLPESEAKIQNYWESMGLYSRCRSIVAGADKFILHDGPPFANGTPHAGTAMNKVLKDMVVRLKQMQGFDAEFVPGWDCHGLAIEWKVEENLREEGKNKDDVPVPEFRDMCRKFAEHWIDVQREGFKKLGVNGDWENPYLTMNSGAEAAVIRVMGRFLLDGTVYRGERPVFWSVVEKTALADAEIEYLEKKSTSIHVAFPIKSAGVPFLEGASCIIWTTTPWSIPGNRAISYAKNIVYAVFESGARKFVVARDLIENFSQATGLECKIIQEFSGELLQNVVCVHPLERSGYDFDVPLLAGEHVDANSGTGLVHTAPEHGVDDFYICRRYGVPLPHTVDDGGLYYDHVPLFAGKHVFRVEEELLQALENAGALLSKLVLTHSYPHSWRSKAPLIYRTTPQWFISMDNTGLRKKALAEIEKICWIPKQGYNRIKSFVENRGDWCISRQRVWGVPLPIFVHRKSGDLLRDEDVLNRIADIFASEGSNAWFSQDSAYFLGNKYDPADYEKITDTMDVWFESGSTYSHVLRDPQHPTLQADLYLEGSDQHRGWFQHSLLNSCGAFGNSPFKSVLTHGFIVDEQGRKMSKSIGNTITLDEVVQKWGADIFRMWVASSDYTGDLKLGMNILRQLEDVYRKLRNTLRYILGALDGHNEKSDAVEYDRLPLLEQWILHRLGELEADLDGCISSYDINRYFSSVYAFCVGDLSSFFFDIRKDCLYCDSPNDPRRMAYRSVLHTLFQHLIRRLAPIIAHTAEEAWRLFSPADTSVHLQTFLPPEKKWTNPSLGEQFSKIKEIRRAVTSALEIARKDKLIGSGLQAAVTLFDPDGIIPLGSEEFWQEVTITSAVKFSSAAIPDAAFVGEGLAKNIGIVVEIAPGEKCERCWKFFTDPNGDKHGDKLCVRCQKVLVPQN